MGRMSWFFSRRKPRGEYPAGVGVTQGTHRSPGLAALAEELSKRRTGAVLDLGASFGENLRFLSRFSSNIVIRDLVSARGERLNGPRASLFQIDVDTLDVADETLYDVILLWDLLHYVDRSDRERFVARIAELSRPGALMLLLASGSTPIPLTPVKFKIQDGANLVYEVQTERRSPSPHFTPRSVERLMKGYRPVRFFQLRNGLQEFLFSYEGSPEEETREPELELAHRAEQPGDWY